MPPRVRSAVLLSIALNAILILAGSYRRSYDAYIHMFFADHYSGGWWSLWEPRWYGGFSVASYPPLAHQLIALLSRLIGTEAAFGVLLLAVLASFPLGVYAFARIFTGKLSARYATLAGAVLPAAYYSAHTFGQLPTLFSLLFVLFALAALGGFLKTGRLIDLLLSVFLAAVVGASHHATLLFLPPSVAAVALHIKLNGRLSLGRLLARLLLFAFPAVVAAVLVVWPFWQWTVGQPLQTPIDHPTRHNYLQDPLAFAGFFLAMYGPLILIIPWVLWRAAGRRMIAPGLLFALLFILGLGGTTGLPALLFGSAWSWLTYDRFALWASTVLLVFLGQFLVLVQRRFRAIRLPILPLWGRRAAAKDGSRHGLVSGATIVIFGSAAIFAGLVPHLAPVQPPGLDLAPIQRFLAANNSRGDYYYLTFGFGDQLARLSRLTGSRTLDGSYHTAREIPELRRSGLAQMDTAFWFAGGTKALAGILESISERGSRYAFVNLRAYIPTLVSHGWRYLAQLPNGVQVWDNPRAPLPEPESPPRESALAKLTWGALPMTALALSGALYISRTRPVVAGSLFRTAYLGSLLLLPLALSFWYYRTLAQGTDPRVYVTYGDTAVFLSDALLLLCVLSWGLERLSLYQLPSNAVHPAGVSPVNKWGSRLTWALLGLAAWATLSATWSIAPHLSLAFALQTWLLFGLFISLRGRPKTWKPLAWGCTAALAAQILFAAVQFSGGATWDLRALGLSWPAGVDAATTGASVVQLPDGTRWLRLYGSLPHPNALGGLLLLLLAGTAWLATIPPGSPGIDGGGGRRSHHPFSMKFGLSVALFGAGVMLLMLTFSRSAWLGLATGASFVFFRRDRFEPRRLFAIGLAALIAGLVVLVPLAQILVTRLTGAVSAQTFNPESTSVVTRYYMMFEAGRLIEAYPVFGSGAGTFVAALARLLPPYFSVEPVHNLFLLAFEELGIPGALITVTVAAWALLAVWRARSPAAILSGALVLALFVTTLFDHYLWTLPPMRTVLWLSLGLILAEPARGEAQASSSALEVSSSEAHG